MRMIRVLPGTLAMLLLSAALVAVQAQEAAPEVQTFMVPMRDGVKLATDVYLPPGKGPFPTVLIRNPYDKGKNAKSAKLGAGGGKKADAQQESATKGNYAWVHQDTRGRYASEGTNLPFEGEFGADHQDGHDTLAWVLKQPWCNGKIGTWGGSANGISQLFMAPGAPVELICQHITVGAPNPYPDFIYPGGIFKTGLAETWLTTQKFNSDALKTWVAHPTFDDFWQKRDVTPRYDKVNVPAVHIAGYYDIFVRGSIDAFLGYNTQGGPKARGTQKLVLGPWTHAVLIPHSGELKFDNGAAPPNNVHDAWRWYDHYLRGVDNGIDKLPAVTYYVMGDPTDPTAPGKEWRTAETWPPVPTKATPYYLHADRSLSTSMPQDDAPLSYSYDPKDPTPTRGGLQLFLPKPFLSGTVDQRSIESRADILVFTGEALGAPLEITGNPKVQLHVSSDCTDTDFFVKLCDVYPDGKSINLCEGQIRARFHASLKQETLLVPGKVYELAIELSPTSIILNKGHKLRVHFASASAPGFEPNPNTGEPLRASTTTKVARNSVYVDAARPSHIVLPVATGK